MTLVSLRMYPGLSVDNINDVHLGCMLSYAMLGCLKDVSWMVIKGSAIAEGAFTDSMDEALQSPRVGSVL